MKNQNGITLIALVITIIVLLILAGVAIAMLSGENGILTRASKASVDSAISTAKELVMLEVNEAITDYMEERYVNNVGGATAHAAVTSALDKIETEVESDGTVDYTFTDKTDAVRAYVTIQSKKDTSVVTYGIIEANGDLVWAAAAPTN